MHQLLPETFAIVAYGQHHEFLMLQLLLPPVLLEGGHIEIRCFPLGQLGSEFCRVMFGNLIEGRKLLLLRARILLFLILCNHLLSHCI